MDGYGYHELQRDALGFVLETENWPAFLQWARDNAVSQEAGQFLDSADPADPIKWRVEWMRHSPDPDVRALSARLFGEPQ